MIAGVMAGGRPVPPVVADTDPYFSSVELLLHGNGADGSTVIVDSSGSPKSVFPTGNTKLSTTQSRFGGSSILLDGNGDAIRTTHAPVFDITTSDFTVEMWVYRAVSGVQHYLVSKREDASQLGFEWRIASANNLQFFYVGGTLLTSGLTVPSGQWVHLAVTKISGIVRQFVNGVRDANAGSFGVATANTQDFIIGTSSDVSGGFDGYIDEFRLTKGVGRYSDTFTTPTAQFPDA